jgi:hypothetical protein
MASFCRRAGEHEEGLAARSQQPDKEKATCWKPGAEVE